MKINYNIWSNGIEDLYNEKNEIIGRRYKNSSYAYIDVIEGKIVNAIRLGNKDEYNYDPYNNLFEITQIIDTVRNFNKNDFEVFCSLFEANLDSDYKPNKYAIETANDVILEYLKLYTQELSKCDANIKEYNNIQNKIVRLCQIKAKLSTIDLEELYNPKFNYQESYGSKTSIIDNKKVYKLTKEKNRKWFNI